ncbi:unnamed protein product [Pleuronectes platessa]|uniref:Uncharacterized protein n=1 Tax=Pleuronectes platessa TaxID=8262 RepID=A0A9N7ZD08_PLEPL|nr:unnamed protein product [Pleuronectes platessa]
MIKYTVSCTLRLVFSSCDFVSSLRGMYCTHRGGGPECWAAVDWWILTLIKPPPPPLTGQRMCGRCVQGRPGKNSFHQNVLDLAETGITHQKQTNGRRRLVAGSQSPAPRKALEEMKEQRL